jgi:hypothetical protein
MLCNQMVHLLHLLHLVCYPVRDNHGCHVAVNTGERHANY